MAVNAGTIYSDVRIQLDKLSGDLKKVDAKFDQFVANNKTNAGKVEKNWSQSFGAIQLAGVAAFAGISLAVKDSIKTFAGFEQSLANVRSVAGATEEEFQKIEDAARGAGETTRFTASQAADALYSLASAGLDATESVAALDGVLQLAGATQSDLAFTSQTVVSTLSQYKLEAEDAARVSNVFAAAIGNSQANMDKLAAAFRQVGPVAGTLGISLEETTGAIQGLLDAGFKGEQAGTALRNILSSLASETDPTTQKLTALGLSFEELDPSVNSFIDIIGNLNEANLEAGQIIGAFGKEAGPQILSLLAVGKQGLEEYTKAVTDTTAAADAYAIQNDTLQGSLDATGSAIESLKIGLISEFSPVIRGIVDAFKNAILFLNQLPGPVKIFLGLLAVGVPAAFGLVSALTALNGILVATGATMGAILGPIALVVGGIAALTAGIVGISGAVRKARLDEIEKRFGGLAENLEISNEKLEKLVSTIETMGATSDSSIKKAITKLKEFQKETGISDDRLDELVKTAKKLGATSDNIADVTATVFNLNEEFGATTDQIKEISRVFDLGGKISESKINLDLVNQQVALLRKETGLSEAAILKIGLASEKVSDVYREQLIIVEKSKRLQNELVTTETKKEIYLAELQKKRAEARQKAIEEEEKREKELETKRLKAIAQSKSVIEARLQAQDSYNEALRINSLLAQEGLITQTELVKREISETEKLIESLFEIGYTAENVEQTFIDATGKRVTRVQQGNLVLRDLIDNILPELKGKLEEVEKVETESGESRNKFVDEYNKKLLDLVGTEEEKRAAAKASALEDIKNANLSEEATRQAVDALDAYYNKLEEISEKQKENTEDIIKFSAEQQKLLNELSDIATTVFDVFNSVFSGIDNLAQASAKKRIEEIESVLQTQISAYDQELQKALEVAGVAEETREEKLKRELEAAKLAGDEQKALEIENTLTRLQIENDFEKKKLDAREAAARKTAKIEYDAAIASYNIKLALAIADAARAIIAGYAQLGPIGGTVAALATGTATGLEIAALTAAKPEPPNFGGGGLIMPIQGYQTGGVVIPGGTGGKVIRAAENGAPELLLNGGGEGAALLDQFASRIARAIGGGAGGQNKQIVILLDMDGKRVAESTATYFNNGVVRIKL